MNQPITGGFAPGNYEGRCLYCRETFVGDKRAVACEACAEIVKAGHQPEVHFDNAEEAEAFERSSDAS